MERALHGRTGWRRAREHTKPGPENGPWLFVWLSLGLAACSCVPLCGHMGGFSTLDGLRLPLCSPSFLQERSRLKVEQLPAEVQWISGSSSSMQAVFIRRSMGSLFYDQVQPIDRLLDLRAVRDSLPCCQTVLSLRTRPGLV